MILHPYATDVYARSLLHWGKPLAVPAWGTSVIVREIDGAQDAAGVYPFAVFKHDADIATGIEQLRNSGLVSLVMVFDAFHCPDAIELERHFDFVRPFKTHYIYRKEKGAIRYDTHHQRALRRAQREVRVESLDLKLYSNSWQSLYDNVITKFRLTGLHAFPEDHAKKISTIEGVTALGAWHDDNLVSCHIFASNGKYAHSHLVASNQDGYDTRAAYAINDFAITCFRDEQVINFGGGAGAGDKESDGLARFKRGFSNDTELSYLCGVILDKERYDALCTARDIAHDTSYFPAYRSN